MTPTVPDGPDTELAAIAADLDDLHTEACSVAMRSEGSVIVAAEEVRDDIASIRDRLRAVLARPAAGRDLTDVEDGPTLNSELGVPPRATARIEQARADQAEGYGSTTSVVEGLLRELDRRAGELVRLRTALARPAVARTDGQPPTKPNPLRTREDWRRAAREDAEAALQETLARSTYRTEGQPPADEQVPGESGPVDLPGQTPMTFEQARAYIDAHFDASRADAAISALYRVPSAAPADDTAVQGWGDVESADFIERARAATAVGSFTAQFDHVYDPSGDFVCESVDHSTAVRIAAALSGAPAHDTAAPEDRITAVRELLNAICDPMDQAEAESHLDILGVTRAEVDEAKRRTAAQPVRGSQDGGA